MKRRRRELAQGIRLFLNFPSIFIPKPLIHVIPIVIVKVPKVFATVRSSLPLSLLLLLLSLLQTFYLFSLIFLQAQRVIRRDVDGPDDASDSTAVKNTQKRQDHRNSSYHREKEKYR